MNNSDGSPRRPFNGTALMTASPYVAPPPATDAQPPPPQYDAYAQQAQPYPQPPTSSASPYGQPPSNGLPQTHDAYAQQAQPYAQQAQPYPQPQQSYGQPSYGQPPAYQQPPAGGYGQPPAGGYGQPPAGGYGQPPSQGYGPPGYAQSLGQAQPYGMAPAPVGHVHGAQIPCPKCQQPTASLKQYPMIRYLVFVWFFVFWGRKRETACGSCMRKELALNTLINLIPANLLWLFIVLPWNTVLFCMSFGDGHSKEVQAQLRQ